MHNKPAYKSAADKKIPAGHEKLDKDIYHARTCYNYLAGELGVNITNLLIKKKIIVLSDGCFVVTEKGKQWLRDHHV